jgi:tRNA-2-methylthio-N6-dimethylallyladenosine synthase
LRGVIESYDGMAVVRTVDPQVAVIELMVAPGCQGTVSELLNDLGEREALALSPWEPHKEAKGDRRYYLATMGCQMNTYDSDYVGQILQNAGYRPTHEPKEADLIVINTCTVRAKAEHKAYSLLGRMAGLKRKRPRTVLAIMGCMAQQEGPRLLEKFPDLDLVLGTREISGIKAHLKRIEGEGERMVATDLQRSLLPPLHRPGYFSGRVSSFVSIMQGCNNFCSYCVVPYVRGREVSRPPQEIIQEVRGLVEQGVQEVTLLGQNVNSYAYGQRGSAFPRLLRTLDRVEGLKRIRFTTSHPKDLSPDLIRCFAELTHLCPHIHLPFQAGSNRILQAMKRGYTREAYIELVARLREARPDMAVTADAMVGFPGESEDDFQLTLDLMRKIQFDMLFSFKYSDRKGTRAATMEGKIPESVKTDRLTMLQSLQREITLKKNRALVGALVDVLVEGESKKGGQHTGRTGTNKVVNFNCNSNILGHIIDVRIKEAFAHSLWGEPLIDGPPAP